MTWKGISKGKCMIRKNQNKVKERKNKPKRSRTSRWAR